MTKLMNLWKLKLYTGTIEVRLTNKIQKMEDQILPQNIGFSKDNPSKWT